MTLPGNYFLLVLVFLGGSSSTSSTSCKENFDYEESLALAMALSKSIYMETPLPVIPGLSSLKSDVLAHPHRDVR